MRALAVTILSFALTAGVLTNAYMQKKQFYPSVVYITKSSPSLAVLYIQAFVLVILMGKLIRKVFFGQLRAAEMEHLIERSWYAVTETCLAFTVFRDDFSPRFVALFTLLLFLKCFHWLAEDRVDYMERSPVISWTFHLRVLSLLALLGSLDGYFISHACYSTLIKGPSVQLVFGFEYAILLTMAIHIFVKYVLHTIDLQSENPWESKAVYLLYAELILGFAKVILYMLFLAIMIKVHTFPLFAIRPMYLTMRAFKKAASDVIMSRRAIRNMNTLYPDATPEDLSAGDNVCIICREEMTEGCKKLPCTHIFHTSCLRSWFQRQQTCPTCRMDVLRNTPSNGNNNRQQQRQQQQQPQQQGAPAANGFPGFPNMPPMWPPMAAQQQQQAAPGASGPATSSAPSTGAAQNTSTSMPGGFPASMFMPPPPPMFMNFNMPAPTPPVDLGKLSTEELQAMEGTERKNIEARVQCLKNIQTLLDGAVLQMQQYTQIVAKLPTTTTSSSSTKTEEKSETKSEESSQDKTQDKQKNTEGGAAGGVTTPTEEPIPEWHNPRTEDDEAAEVRRRRLEKFKNIDARAES